jgi:hypothetical protein
MMRRTAVRVKSLPVIYVIGAFSGLEYDDLNMTKAHRPSSSRLLTISMI